MATHPIAPIFAPDYHEPERRLTREEGWALIVSLFGSAKEIYAEVGGSDAFMRVEREAWEK